MSTDQFLIWDFDGTLAFRPGNWTGVVCDVVAAERPDVGLMPARLRPHLQSLRSSLVLWTACNIAVQRPGGSRCSPSGR